MPTGNSKMLRAIVTVTNDLTTDQRVHRSCMTLAGQGYHVTLMGRKRKNSLPLAPRTYHTVRMSLSFDKGPWFYANHNFRLFLFILLRKADLILSNDLDTLAGCYYAWRIKRFFGSGARLMHDCHEYFRGVPELVGRKTTTRIWKAIEDHVFPKLHAVIAVNASVADMYSREYGKEVTVVRNVPFRRTSVAAADKTRFGIEPAQKVILYQGSVNVERGLEEAIQAMKFLRSDARLVIAGTGDVFEKIRQFAKEQKVSGKVIFLGQVPLEDLPPVTAMADLGLSIEKDVSLNYHYALPNKFLDYIQAGVPVLVSPFPEMRALVDKYYIGEMIENHDPSHIAARIDGMLMNPGRMELYRQNLALASSELCWEKEESRFLEALKRANES
jgi:glycosyltransferase involved in cell wall biosynthesis